MHKKGKQLAIILTYAGLLVICAMLAGGLYVAASYFGVL